MEWEEGLEAPRKEIYIEDSGDLVTFNETSDDRINDLPKSFCMLAISNYQRIFGKGSFSKRWWKNEVSDE